MAKRRQTLRGTKKEHAQDARNYLREAQLDIGRFPPGGCEGVAVIGERIAHNIGRGLAHAWEAKDNATLAKLRKMRTKFRKRFKTAVQSCQRR